VTSGEFLLDSESRLKEAVEKMLGSNVAAGADGGAAADTDGGASADGGHDAR
jgi:hypothetical protein